MTEPTEPRAASVWRRLSRGVRRLMSRLRRSQATAEAAREYVGVIPVLAGQVRESASQIEHSVLRSRQNAELSMDAMARIEDVIRAMKTIGNTTDDVDRIAFGLRILALNAQSESGHLGDRGASVAVVADEISQHADQATAMAEGIRSTVAGLETSLAVAIESLRQLAETDMTALTKDKDNAERLQHVIETLSEMQDDFVAALEGPGQRLERADAAALRLRKRYTMAEARRVERPAAALPAHENVELSTA